MNDVETMTGDEMRAEYDRLEALEDSEQDERMEALAEAIKRRNV